MLLVTSDGIILVANPRAEELLAHSSCTLPGTELGALLADESEAPPEYIRTCCRTGDAIPAQLLLRRSDGGVLLCSVDTGLIDGEGREDPVIWLRLLPQQSTHRNPAILDKPSHTLAISGHCQLNSLRLPIWQFESGRGGQIGQKG
jgi:hypothetical protein